jgi:hypothetical protein
LDLIPKERKMCKEGCRLTKHFEELARLADMTVPTDLPALSSIQKKLEEIEKSGFPESVQSLYAYLENLLDRMMRKHPADDLITIMVLFKSGIALVVREIAACRIRNAVQTSKPSNGNK